MNPHDPKHLRRLNDAIDASFKRLGKCRESARTATKLFAGHHYLDKIAADRKQAMNLIKAAVTALAGVCCPKNSAISISSRYPDCLPYAKELEIATKHVADMLSVVETIRRGFTQACFSMAPVKIGRDRDSAKEVDVDGRRVKHTRIFASLVQFEDWFHDAAARTPGELRFMGDIYPMPITHVREQFKKAKDLKPDERMRNDPDGDERSDALDSNEDAFIDDMIYLRDVWLPRERLVITTPLNKSDVLLNVATWDGPDNGPYHILGFHHVPGQVMPVAPACDWMDVHEMVADCQRKLFNQSMRQKDFVGVQAGAGKDGSVVVNAEDGGVYKFSNPNGAREFHMGGPNPSIGGFVQQLLAWFNFITGNMNTWAGLGPSSGTFGQDRILNENSAKFIQDFQYATQQWVKSILTGVAYFIHSDPVDEYRLEKPIEGTDRTVEFVYSPELRDAEWFDLTFDTSAFSKPELTPLEQYVALKEILAEIIIPLLSQQAQPTAQPDIDNIVRVACRLRGLDIIESLVQFAAPSPFAMPQPRNANPPPSTPRRYEHVSRPAARPNQFMEQMPGPAADGWPRAGMSQLQGVSQ